MTKIDIVSGFLGAGKTTLIKKLLKDALAGTKVVLIENEFGEIGIDGGFLKEAGIEIKEMNSGCICCSLVGDFGTSLREVMATYAPERILIEPSGVGKLSDVMRAISDAAEGSEMELNSAVAVVDASKCKMYAKNFGEFFLNQITYAGTVILTRADKASKEKMDEAVALVKEHNPKARIITTPLTELDGKQILDTIEGNADLEAEMLAEVLATREEEHHHHHHDDEDEHCCGHEHHHHDEDHDDEHDHEHHHHHDDEDEHCCGHEHHHHDEDHDHEHDHEHHHHHDDEDEHCCGHEHHHHDEDHDDEHDHEHHHHHDDEDEHCCGHEHHHHDEDHDHEHDHEHHHHHDDEDEHCCGHEHHHHDEDHDDDHDHDHDHHHHDEHCGCGHHHHHHDADEVFTSWGLETPAKYTIAQVEGFLKALEDEDKYGIVLRAKGMVAGEDGSWIHFDYVPQESDVRTGAADVTGKICVIGSGLKEEALQALFTC